MRLITPTLSICALAAAFAAGALAIDPSADEPDSAAEAELTIDDSGLDAPIISIDGFAFDGATVPAGAVVRVVNHDSVPHTVTADDGSFDVSLGAGEETTFVAPADLGTFQFFCGIHPSMTGVLSVA